jgi:hypothetical protein
MEEYFNEFFKNQLITVEKGQKQMQDMTKLIMQGLSGFEEVPEMFGKFCSMDFWSKETCDYIKAWEMTREDFQKFFKDYLNLMGLVPKHEHLALINKYNDQKKEITDQKKLLADREEAIVRHNKIVTDQKKEISKQKMLVVDQNKLVADLKKEISDQKKVADDQHKEIANQKKRVADLEKEIAGHIKSIKQLQSQASD